MRNNDDECYDDVDAECYYQDGVMKKHKALVSGLFVQLRRMDHVQCLDVYTGAEYVTGLRRRW